MNVPIPHHGISNAWFTWSDTITPKVDAHAENLHRCQRRMPGVLSATIMKSHADAPMVYIMIATPNPDHELPTLTRATITFTGVNGAVMLGSVDSSEISRC